MITEKVKNERFKEILTAMAMRKGYGVRAEPKVIYEFFEGIHEGIYCRFSTKKEYADEELYNQTFCAEDSIAVDSYIRYCNIISSEPIHISDIEKMHSIDANMRMAGKLFSYWCDDSIHDNIVTIEMLISRDRCANPYPYDPNDEFADLKKLLAEQRNKLDE